MKAMGTACVLDSAERSNSLLTWHTNWRALIEQGRETDSAADVD